MRKEQLLSRLSPSCGALRISRGVDKAFFPQSHYASGSGETKRPHHASPPSAVFHSLDADRTIKLINAHVQRGVVDRVW